MHQPAHFTWLTLGSPKKPIFVRPYQHRKKDGEFPHDHNFIEIVLVARGQALHVTQEGVSPISVGSVIVIHPGAWHDFRECLNFKVYNCCFAPELLRHELSWLIDDPILGSVLWNSMQRGSPRASLLQLEKSTTPRCCDLASELSSFLRDSPFVSSAEATARLAVYFTALSTSFSQRPANLKKAMKSTHPAVMHCMKQIEADLARDWTLPELALSCRTCREHLTRLFKQKTGLSPITYLDKRRAEQAAHLLEKTTLSVNEIGFKTGWSSPVTFSRRFKAHFGITATAYRQKLISAVL